MTHQALAGRRETPAAVRRNGAPVQRPLRWHIREGMEAALKSNPRKLAQAETRTGVGLMVRGLLLEAGRGTTAAVRLVLQFIDWKPPKDEGRKAPPGTVHEQGVICKFEPEWEWDATGKWDTDREPEPAESKDAANGAERQILEQKLIEKLTRLHQAELDKQERRAKPGTTTALSGILATAAPPPD